MDCGDVRTHLRPYQLGRLSPELEAEVRAHFVGCPTCAQADAEDRALTDLLERRLPQYPASLALKRRLAQSWPAPPVSRIPWWRRWGRSLTPALAALVLLLVALPLYQRASSRADGTEGMVREAVNDYLRVLSSQHPLDIESGGIHQVKPWFEGRLNFAPVIPFEGDQEFPLKGGAVGYFFDRKAAVFVYGRRLHTISLFVFPADGLPWPTRGLVSMGNARAYTTTARGFNVVLWRAGDLGYALVSDLDVGELFSLGKRLSA
ncbi:MAG TPA: zf-HC2 domain-containing protein [Candidatus Sulfotelmatobacter sp.]|nr:zf-HC2 domain-containing protein [Candidatus Sulfotelmatobacter sp.]